VLVYPADKDAPPFVLPEALTPGMVVSYLEKTTAKPAPAQAAADR